MINLSPGLLYSAQKLVETVSSHAMDRDEFLWSFRTILVSPAEGVLALSTRCGWIGINEQLGLSVTDMGQRVQTMPNVEDKLRQQIKDYIQAVQPAWAKLLPAGRAEALPFMPEPARQCFSEAGLTSFPPADAAISWWDDLTAAARGRLADYLAQVGREGERSSIAYEFQRIGRHPEWHSIESNRSGFDSLSCKDVNDHTELQIEVKASEQPPSAASFYLTRNEWDIAITAPGYVFHIWSLTTERKLAILSPTQMEEHVPVEKGSGRWETLRIPFKIFASSFLDVPKKA
jgi:hypothetical protein